MNGILVFWRVLLWLGAAVAIASAFLHVRFTPWRSSSMGRQLAAYLTALAAVFALTAVNSTLRGHAPIWLMWVEMAVFIILVATMFWRLVLQWVWRPRRERERARGEEDRLHDENTVHHKKVGDVG